MTMWSHSSKGGPGELIRTICRSCLWRKVVPPTFSSQGLPCVETQCWKAWQPLRTKPSLEDGLKEFYQPSRGIFMWAQNKFLSLWDHCYFGLFFIQQLQSINWWPNQFFSSCLFIVLHLPGRIIERKGKDILVERNILPNPWQSNNNSNKNVQFSHLKNTFTY